MSSKGKVILAVVLFVLAAVALAWQFGAFDGGPKGADDTETPEIVETTEDSGVVDGRAEDGRNVRGYRPGFSRIEE